MVNSSPSSSLPLQILPFRCKAMCSLSHLQAFLLPKARFVERFGVASGGFVILLKKLFLAL